MTFNIICTLKVLLPQGSLRTIEERLYEYLIVLISTEFYQTVTINSAFNIISSIVGHSFISFFLKIYFKNKEFHLGKMCTLSSTM